MSKELIMHKGRRLVPVRIDRNTWVLLPEDRVAPDTAEKFREAMRRSKALAMRSGWVLKNF